MFDDDESASRHFYFTAFVAFLSVVIFLIVYLGDILEQPTYSVNVCGGYVGDIDFGKQIPGTPFHVSVLCQDQTEHTVTIN
jgi:hypothetical protein